MREIKFRAWDTKPLEGKSKMIYGIDNIKDFYEGIVLFDELLNPKEAGAPEIEIMQFTGIKDKNGKEIYEGDIVLFDQYITKFEIVFFKGCYFLENNNTCFGINICKETRIEVIGNIKENPELLSQKEGEKK